MRPFVMRHGRTPGALLMDAAGNLYGATWGGMLFELDTTGNATMLYIFTGGPSGKTPLALW
jgi:hypothetical protein